jgi:hypothetical protein
MGRTVFFLLGSDVTSLAMASAAVKLRRAIGKTNAAEAGRAFDSREYRPCRDFTNASQAITSTHKQGHKAIESEIA